MFRQPQSSESVPAWKSALAALLLASAASSAIGHAANAPAYPQRPVRMIVPFPAGGSIDVVSRSIAQRWNALLGQQIVIDNRGGAAGTLGASLVALAQPDGYTLLYANNGPLCIAPNLYAKLPYDVSSKVFAAPRGTRFLRLHARPRL